VRLKRNSEFLDRVLAGDDDQGDESRDVEVRATDVPLLADLRFSNRCNLKCRTCWHGASSRWYADSKALGLPVGPVAEIESFAPGEVLEQLEPMIPSLEMIYFAGGEPLMAPDHGLLLQHLIDIGRTDIELEYNSNMMLATAGAWDVLDLWEQFDVVRLEASIDGTGEVGALVRSGFEWSTFRTNVDEFRRRIPHGELTFGITASALNITHVPELVRELRATWPDVSLSIHAVIEPEHYRIDVLPQRTRELVAREIDQVVTEYTVLRRLDEVFIAHMRALATSLCTQRGPASSRDNFRAITAALDGHRSESTVEVLPALAPALRGRRWPVARRRARSVLKLVIPVPVRKWLTRSRRESSQEASGRLRGYVPRRQRHTSGQT
jgi:sulfatase maturation enzyme AslB (radical SAM superfamily)